ncbi:hypothetical protein LCGC14_0782420 [marine sediment metagenome]|uniref:Uncharacterized protein n=1 Tax=marine sediment metagenome TaxID=412755 RepID=A0A0F9SEX7_9ZZZZ
MILHGLQEPSLPSILVPQNWQVYIVGSTQSGLSFSSSSSSSSLRSSSGSIVRPFARSGAIKNRLWALISPRCPVIPHSRGTTKRD